VEFTNLDGTIVYDTIYANGNIFLDELNGLVIVTRCHVTDHTGDIRLSGSREETQCRQGDQGKGCR